MKDFGEILTAVITPFDNNGVISTDIFWRLCKKLVHEKSEGLVLSGSQTITVPQSTHPPQELWRQSI